MAHVKYVWDPIEDNIIRERDENGNTLVDYTTRPTLYGSVLSQDRGGEIRHYHFDGHGNTSELTDVFGNVTDTRRYSAFGEVTESTGTTVFPYQWGGQNAYHFTAESSTLSHLSREFHATSGRWLSREPRTVSMPYVFVGNIPTLLSPQAPSTLPISALTLGRPMRVGHCGRYELERTFAVTVSQFTIASLRIHFVQEISVNQLRDYCRQDCGDCRPYRYCQCDVVFWEIFGPLVLGPVIRPGTYLSDVDTWSLDGTQPPCSSKGNEFTIAEARAFFDLWDWEVPGGRHNLHRAPEYSSDSRLVCGECDDGTEEGFQVSPHYKNSPPDFWYNNFSVPAGHSTSKIDWKCCPGDWAKGETTVNGRPLSTVSIDS